MTSGFFIKLETDDGADIEAVPHFWFSEGKCRIPVTELERKAENNEMFVNWPIYEATILLQHSKLYYPFVCCIVCVPALQLLIIFQKHMAMLRIARILVQLNRARLLLS